MSRSDLVVVAREGDILAPGASVRVIGKIHPFSGGRVERTVEAGLSIDEILAAALADHPVLSGRRDFVVHLDGHAIEQKNWRKVRVKAGATVTFRPRLQNSTVLRTVLTVVVAIAAAYIAGPAATLIGFAEGTAAFSIATAVIATGVILAGSLALNALFPVAKASVGGNETARTLNSIQGARNQANLFGAIAVVLGTHRQSPNYAAAPYTEIYGDDQYLRLLFCLGYGPLDITDLRIGETPLSSFSEYEIEVLPGLVGDAAPTLYPGDVNEQQLSIELNSVDSWLQRTTAVDADQISIDVTAPNGVFEVDPKTGNYNVYVVVVQAQYSPAGLNSWTSMGSLSFSRSASTIRHGLIINVARGQYDVRVRKFTGDANSAYVRDQVAWTALRSFTNQAPIAFPKPLALVALRIKATAQLSGVIDTFNCVCTSRVLAYSGSVWNADTASQNPADLFRHVLQGPANARPVADTAIDIENLQDWWSYCVSKGFKFNEVVTSAGALYDKLCEIAAAGRAVPTFINGKWGVIWDRPADPIVQHFTPRNSWAFQGQKAYAQQPHGWRVSFINEDNGYSVDERIVYDDGYNVGNATLFEGLKFPGVTDPDLIWKHGRFQIAQARLRPEKFTINVGWENLICTRGDRVAVTHDVMLVGLAAARVKSVVGQVVTFDELVTVEAGKTYAMSFRLASLTSPILRALDVTAAGDYTSLTLVGDLSGVAAEPGCLCAFGETGQAYGIYRVQAIAHQKDLIASLVLVDDAQAISTADSGAIPVYTPNITIPADPFTLPVRDLKYLEVIDGKGSAVRASVALTWQVPRFGNIASFEVQQRDDDALGAWQTIDSVLPPATSSQVPLIAAGTWSFRVRCLFTNGTASDWVLLDHLALLGLSAAPDPIANLRNTFISGREFLSWDSPTDPRTIPVEIRKGASFASAQIVEDAAVSPWQTVGDDLYWVTAYATSPFGVRNYASPTQSILIVGSVALQNIVVSHDEAAEHWAGTFVGSVGIDTDNNFLRTGGDDDFLARGDFLGTGNFIDGDGTLQGGGIYWSPTTVNTGGVTFCRISNDWTATGVQAMGDFLANPDFLGEPDFLHASLSQFVRVRPVVRVSQVGPVPVWGATQVWSPDVYQGWMFQLGMQFEILATVAVPDPGAIAVLQSWQWTIDVPDRLDSYQNLTIPAGVGLPIIFRPTGALADLPFNGGLNGEALPHLTPSIQNPDPGDQVVWTSLSLAGATLHVMNGGVSVGGDQVNVLVRGY